jgi:hypothetical protein
MVPNRRAIPPIVAMLQKNGLDMRVMSHNSKEFRPAISAISDNADLLAQVIEYSSL